MGMNKNNHSDGAGSQTAQCDRLYDLLLAKAYRKARLQRKSRGDINIEPFYQVSLQVAFNSEGLVTDIR